MSRAIQSRTLCALTLFLLVFALFALPSVAWAGEQDAAGTASSEDIVATEGEVSGEDAADIADSAGDVPSALDEGAAPEAAPSGQVEPAATPEPVEPVSAPEPAAPAEPVPPAVPAEPAVEPEPATPAEPAVPAEPEAPADPAPVATENPVEPVEPQAAPEPADETLGSDAATSQKDVPAAEAKQACETASASAAAVAPVQAAKKASAKKAATAPVKNPLANGTYLLAWAKSPKFIVQSSKGSRKAGANVQLVKKKSTSLRQRWVVKYVAAYGAYTIVNEYAKKALAVVSGKNGANVVQVKSNAGDELQLWSLEKVGRCYVFSPKANPKLAITGEKKNGQYDLVLRAVQRAKTQRLFAFDEGIVPDGIYSLAPTRDAKKSMTVPKNYVKGKTTPWWYSYEGDLRQKYQLVYQGNNEYTIQSVHSGRNLGVSGSTVVQRVIKKSANQRWIITWNKTGLGLRNAATRERLVAPATNAKGKARLSTVKAANNESQRFTLKSRHLVDNGVYIVQSFGQDLALAAQDGSLAENSNIDVETTSKSNAQKFRIKYLKGGRYRITNLKSGLVVGYVSGNAGANVQQRADNGSPSQLFTAQVAPGGGIQFVGVNGGKVLSFDSASGKSGANVRMEKSTGGKNQRWWLLRTQENPDEDITDRALQKAQRQGSATNWYLAVDVTNHRTIILKRSGKSWKVAANWLCSTGAPETPTVLGSYTVGIKGYSFGEGFTCYYYTQFWGDYLFHSVKYYEGTFNVKDGRLGQDVSEGCVRLPLNKAKWIYDHIPEGTRVVTYQ